uniref:Uncharacterized protein n=1 Tax=Arundo donax TaxID=35708 RepID=A0A0A9A0G8_ARUDO
MRRVAGNSGVEAVGRYGHHQQAALPPRHGNGGHGVPSTYRCPTFGHVYYFVKFFRICCHLNCCRRWLIMIDNHVNYG